MRAKDEFPLRVSRVLWEVWDPIGINEFPEAQGEYDSYVPVIVRMLREGTTEDALVSHLLHIEVELMELPGYGSRTQAAASAQLALPRT